MSNKYGAAVIKQGAFPRPLKDSQCRGMVEMGSVEPKPSGNGGHKLSPADIRRRREERRERSTKGMAQPDRSVPATGPVRTSSRRLSVSAGRVIRGKVILEHYWLPKKRKPKLTVVKTDPDKNWRGGGD